MLSFMREQGSGNPSDRPSSSAGAQDGRSSDNAGGQEYYTVASNKKNLRRSTILVAILVGIGLVGLGLMIRRIDPQAASAKQAQEEEAKIDAAISRITGVRSEMVDRMDEIVQKFYEFSDVSQVKVNELVKDPFEVEGYVKDLKDEIIIAEDPQVQAALIRRRRLQQQADTLRLFSIMRSDIGQSCVINDQILQKGDSIQGTDFTVARVESNFVEVVWLSAAGAGTGTPETEELKIVLKLSE